MTVAALTPLTAIAVGKAAKKYDDDNKVVCAKQQLLSWSRNLEKEKAASTKSTKSKEVRASAWLSTASPKFPYLLSISSGDDPDVVLNAYVA